MQTYTAINTSNLFSPTICCCSCSTLAAFPGAPRLQLCAGKSRCRRELPMRMVQPRAAVYNSLPGIARNFPHRSAWSQSRRVTFSFKMRSVTCTTSLAMGCSLLRSAGPAKYSRGNNALLFRHDQVHPFAQNTHPSHCPEESQDLQHLGDLL